MSAATATATSTDPFTRIAVLRSRAAGLRAAAEAMDGPLALAYRRRAAELALTATAQAARLGLDERTPVAA